MSLFDGGAAPPPAAPGRGQQALVPDFDPARPVGRTTTVVEASAGTGKTHAVASLVVAEVAAGTPLDQVLVVTFTRKATATLRDRIRRRLAHAAATLAEPATAPSPTADPLLAHLAAGDVAVVAGRRRRLEDAVAGFDAATIATTHGFCQQVLAGIGVAGDAERGLDLVDDVQGMVRDAVDDLFVRRFHGGDHDDEHLRRDDALAVARAVVANPDAVIARVDGDPTAHLRYRFARTLRDRIDEQKRRGRVMTYDDLLTRLDRSLADEGRGPLVAEHLRQRFTLVVVDEFQDTDAVQWRILERAFGRGAARLVLVGDPKQAIYAFRGGDVHTYLRATEGCDTYRLATSWRSDGPLLRAVDAVLDGAQLGDVRITHQPLTARPGADVRRLVGPGAGAPLTLRGVVADDPRLVRTRAGAATKDSVRRIVADDLAAEVTRMLAGGVEVLDTDLDGHEVARRALRPGDLCVLTRRAADAERACAALGAAGVPAVFHGGDSVFASDAATAWLDLLSALEVPSSSPRVHAVARSPFVGWDAAAIAGADDDAWSDLDDRLHDWASSLRHRGVAGLLHDLEADGDLARRLLGVDGGERTLSDLRHVAELLHAHHAAHPSTVSVLAGWLTGRIVDTSGHRSDGDPDDARRRLDSDADAVTLQTIHSAKGLEWPVVLLPSLWEEPWTDPDRPPVFHDEERRRSLAVGGKGDTLHAARAARAATESAGEELRLLYVSLTRARHRVVAWWSPQAAGRSPFARLVLGRDDTGAVPDEVPGRVEEPAVRDRLGELVDELGGDLAVEDATGDPVALPAVAPEPGPLAVARFGRTLDRAWTRTSYSGLTAAAHDAPLPLVPVDGTEVVEADDATTMDEPVEDADAVPADGDVDGAAPGLLDPVPGGARIGSLVHDALEHVDFATVDLTAAVGQALRDAGAARLVEGHVDVLTAGLAAALSTPLGPRFGERPLTALGRADRLDELAFELPVAGGDDPTGLVTMTAVADVFARHLPAGDPVADVGYHVRLLDPVVAGEFRGFLTGSIDLVARIDGRHVVVDYKTNHLGRPPGARPAIAYGPAAMAAAMADAHYPLQAALYAVALHRYLRWRLPAYDPGAHLGGVGYLFLRGMTGPDVARTDGAPDGVFAWHPPAAFVLALSDLLDRGAPT